MAAKKNLNLPPTSRYTFTVQKDLLKEVWKFSIDYEIDERDIPELALRYLMSTYSNLGPQERAEGLSYYLPELKAKEEGDI